MKKDVYDLPPDLFSRNSIFLEVIAAFRKTRSSRGLKILDIGGRNGRMADFITTDDQLTIIDIRPGNEENLIVGDATNMKMFSDNEFDIVLSGDVFEHVPSAKREKFLSEMIRVCAGVCILAAPFDSQSNLYVENAMNQQYKSINGVDHEWLFEHIREGLPKAAILEKYLKSKKIKFSKIQSNEIENWLLMQNFIFLADHFSFDGEIVHKYYQAFNKKMKSIEGKGIEYYRTIYIIPKESFSFKYEYEYEENENFSVINTLFFQLALGMEDITRKQGNQLNEHIQALTTRLGAVEVELKALKSGRFYKVYRFLKKFHKEKRVQNDH